MKRFALLFSSALFACLSVAPVVLAADPMDWPNWRGPEQDGISREVGLIDSFDPKTGKNVLWKRPDMGTRSTPIVMNGKLYALAPSEMTTPREGEKVYCLDAATGKTIWEQRFNVYLSDVPSERTAWSNVAGDPETGNVYALGVCGLFQCFDGETGKVLWKRSLHEEFGLLSTYGGRTNTPVVFENLVLISSIVVGWGDMARPTHRFMAFDKRTGEMVWFAGTRPLPYDTNYSTPSIKLLGGQMAMVFGSGDGGVWALQPRTGRPIWKYQMSPFAGLNVSPLIEGDTVYMAQSDENRDGVTSGSVAAINGTLKGPPGNDITEKGERWLVKQVIVNRSSPLLIDGRLYIFSDFAKLWIFDAKTGKQIGATSGGARKENYVLGAQMRASPLYADGKIYIATMDARWHVLKPTANGVAPVKQGRANFLRLQDAGFDEQQKATQCYGSAIASHGRIYLPTTECLYCLGDETKQPKIGVAAPPAAVEPAPAAVPAQVQVIPCDAVLEPGKTQKFRVRLFNANGQLLKDAPAEFSLTGAGKIDTDGLFTADTANKHQAVTVTAKMGDVTGTARVRVIPPLPWSFDLSDGVPITWIGMRFRHISVDAEVLQDLRKADAADGTQAADLYEGLSFYGTPKVVFDDALPSKSWSALLSYLGRDPASAATLADAQNTLDPSLKVLAAKKVIATSAWATGKAGPQLTVALAEQPKNASRAIYKLPRILVPGGVTKLGTRSQGFIGPAYLHDYTIEADVMATIKPGKDGKPGTKIGEIGLSAQGYTLAVLGMNKRLQIHTWAAQATADHESRGAKRLEGFELKPDAWYRMKLSVANEGDKAVARGKIWARDDKEPADWMLTLEDATPNRTGSPGFFGNARDPASPFYIDNVVVKANE